MGKGQKERLSYQGIVDLTDGELTKNPEWVKRYSEYYDKVKANEKYVKTISKCFRPNLPLVKYLTVSKVMDGENSVDIDLRVMGHSVAVIKVKPDKELAKRIRSDSKNVTASEIQNQARIIFNKAKSSKNNGKEEPRYVLQAAAEQIKDEKRRKDFNDNIKKLLSGEKGDVKWNSTKMKKLRSLLQQEKSYFEVVTEHTTETFLLSQLSEDNGDVKYVKNIQPCTISGLYYQFPTPLGASGAKEDDVHYSGQNGGGIDILSRVKRGNRSELCVIELKKKYAYPERVMNQAIAYTTFIIRLLRSEEAKGQAWYEHFGMKKTKITPDKPITVNAVVAMPFPDSPKKQPNTSFVAETEEVNVGKDIIKLHYMYFKKEALVTKNMKDGIVTSLFN